MSNYSRTPAVLISTIYLFGPMVVSSPTQAAVISKPPSYVTQSQLGKGGPEEQPYIIKKKYEGRAADVLTRALLPLDAYHSPFDQEEEQEELTPIVRVVNYMKVSNTTWPVDVPEVSSEYGWRTPPCDGCSADHRGVDFVPGENTPVYAVTDGIIVDMGYNSGYGNYIRMEHLVTNNEGELETWETVYAHMANNSLTDGLIIGSAVKTGEVIGRVGSTGVSTGPHLHFELLIDGEHVDPFPLLGTHQILELDEERMKKYRYSGEVLRSEAKVVGYE